MTSKEKLLKISHDIFNKDSEGIDHISPWLLAKNGYIYTFRQSKDDKNKIVSLLEENNILFEIKNNIIGEMLILQ